MNKVKDQLIAGVDYPFKRQMVSKTKIKVKMATGEIRNYISNYRESYLEGWVFEYKVGKKQQYVAISKNYAIYLEDGQPMIPVEEGMLTPSGLYGDRPESPADELSVMIDTKIKTQQTRSIAGKVEFPWKWVLIGVGVIVIIAVLYIGLIKPMIEKGSDSDKNVPAKVTPVKTNIRQLE